MAILTENHIELLTIKRLKSSGYHYLYGHDNSSDGVDPERNNNEEVLLLQHLKHAVRRIKPDIPVDAQNEAIKEIRRIVSPELIANNETFHRLLIEGILVTKRVDGDDRGDWGWLYDFKYPYRQFSMAFITPEVDRWGRGRINNN